MKIQVNGESRDVEDLVNIADLLPKIGIPEKGVAIELNRRVISKELWGATDLREGDILEIVHFVGGGI